MDEKTKCDECGRLLIFYNEIKANWKKVLVPDYPEIEVRECPKCKDLFQFIRKSLDAVSVRRIKKPE